MALFSIYLLTEPVLSAYNCRHLKGKAPPHPDAPSFQKKEWLYRTVCKFQPVVGATDMALWSFIGITKAKSRSGLVPGSVFFLSQFRETKKATRFLPR